MKAKISTQLVANIEIQVFKHKSIHWLLSWYRPTAVVAYVIYRHKYSNRQGN